MAIRRDLIEKKMINNFKKHLKISVKFDMLWLAKRGHEVVGIECSKIGQLSRRYILLQ